MKARFKEIYEKEIAPALLEKYGYANRHEIPRLDKIVINMGVGEATQDRKHIENAANDLGRIAGQKPLVTKARKSNASFKIREDMAIGCKVTLRGERMYEFLDRFITIALPRVRDFRGVNPKGFDGKGNFSMGIREHIIFPEIDYDKTDKIKGLNVSVVTTANTDEEARALLAHLGMPFRKPVAAGNAQQS